MLGRCVVWVLGACIPVLMGIHLITGHPLFDINGEYTIPAYFNSALFLFGGIAAYGNALLGRRVPGMLWPRFVLGTALVFAAIDEVIGIHEEITGLTNWYAGTEFHNVWMLIYIPIMALGAWVLRPWWRWLRSEAPKSAHLLLLGLGCWFLSFPFELGVQFEVLPQGVWPYAICIEETLEMLGALLWLDALLSARRTARIP